MATIKDVARLAGVSFKTVSRVINGVTSVDPDLQRRVRAAINELGYQPNLPARQLRGAPSSIAFIYDNPNSHYVIELQEGILAECHARGFELIIHPCYCKSVTLADELRELVRRADVGGLVLTPPLSEMSAIVDVLVDSGAPFVRVISGSTPPDALSPCVYVDDRRAAYNITRHLVDLGHERIAFLAGDAEHRSTTERLEGYRQACRERGIGAHDDLVLAGRYTFESGVERTTRLLATAAPPTAVFACNDEIAAGALFAARMQDVTVPGGLSIAGFEDSPFSRQSWPNVTTARQSNEDIARNATILLIDEIARRRNVQAAPPENQPAIGIRPQLIVRDSTGALVR